jgi:5-methylcytosine-specific restriction endonuclease McrA
MDAERVIRQRKPIKRSWLKRSTKPIRKVSAKQRNKIAVRRKIRERWWAEGNRTCGICGLWILEFEDMTNDHILPGSAKDDSEANLQPAHVWCNNEKGSIRNFLSPRRANGTNQ